MKLSPLERASLMSVREHGMDGVTPKVSSGVTIGGDECLITFLAGSPAFLAISDSERKVSSQDSQCIMTA